MSDAFVIFCYMVVDFIFKQMKPSSFPVWMDIQTLPSDQPSIIEFPTGTIPILRTNGSGTIAAHSYDGQLEVSFCISYKMNLLS